ncbi:hypothetical protein [Aureimonas sp. AU4]|uniref:hypothetical protein n=1 Tax=Aureimonas sp. AU4 TaxID=1638163 RepID=UPI00078133FE|nr:hypothetical protein [Aureimonas sp. AU4]
MGTLTIAEGASDGDASRLSAWIAREIGRIMRERAAHGLPTYRLAQLGNALGPELRRLERLTGRRLADIVREDCGYEIVVPADRPDAPFVTLGDALPPRPRVRVPEGVWRAFTTALPAGMTRRFVVAAARHVDADERAPSFPGGVPVPARLIHPAPPRHLFDAVASTIGIWADAHRIGWPEAMPAPPPPRLPTLARRPRCPTSAFVPAPARDACLLAAPA